MSIIMYKKEVDIGRMAGLSRWKLDPERLSIQHSGQPRTGTHQKPLVLQATSGDDLLQVLCCP